MGFLESFYKAYETEPNQMVINGRKFEILLPKYLDRYINTHDVMNGFPMWAKIWQASWILAGYLAEMSVDERKNFLEIGGGVGLVSIVATAFGHQITMTEYNPDALQFARANAILNKCPQLTILRLDWNHPRPIGRFDTIVASEVSYREEDIQPLLTLFKNCLKTDGEVILVGEMRRSTKDIYQAFEIMFDIRVLNKALRSNSEEIKIFIFRMKMKAEQ
jgi:predicted nicotinamide N-methyase